MSFRRPFVILSALLLLGASTLFAQWTPPRSSRLVNDYSSLLSSEQQASLEQRLVAFADSTSNQITIVITPTLHGDEIMAVAQRIGESWGVGQDKLSNGLVILIKSHSPDEDYGDVAISTGYGLEGALPDAFCKRIIDDKMIAPLSNGNYYQALIDALDVIEPVIAGEYSYSQYKKDETISGLIGLLVSIVVVVLLLLLVARYNKKHPNNNSSNGMGGTPTGGMTFGSWPTSSGRFGSTGGFGGFGGGHFGGGGAHGRF